MLTPALTDANENEAAAAAPPAAATTAAFAALVHARATLAQTREEAHAELQAMSEEPGVLAATRAFLAARCGAAGLSFEDATRAFAATGEDGADVVRAFLVAYVAAAPANLAARQASPLPAVRASAAADAALAAASGELLAEVRRVCAGTLADDEGAPGAPAPGAPAPGVPAPGALAPEGAAPEDAAPEDAARFCRLLAAHMAMLAGARAAVRFANEHNRAIVHMLQHAMAEMEKDTDPADAGAMRRLETRKRKLAEAEARQHEHERALDDGGAAGDGAPAARPRLEVYKSVLETVRPPDSQ